MYAVVKTGGKQYRVSAGTKIKVEQLPADVGSEVTLDQVLMIAEDGNVKLGSPLLFRCCGKSQSRSARARRQGAHFQNARRKHYRKSQGHRQNFTELEITGIAG